MSKGNELPEELRFLVALLKGDSDLTTHAPGGVHTGLAPAKLDVYPFVVAQLQNPGSGDVVAANPSERTMHWGQWLIKAVGPETKSDDLVAAASDIDRLLQAAAQSSTATAYILACYRLAPFFLPEEVNGQMFWNIGGLYQVGAEMK